MIRLAVLGAGAHSAGNHGPALRRCRDEQPDGVELAAVCDLDLARANAYAERFGFARAYADLDAMVRQERPDGIVAVTPVEVTEEVAGRIARLGIPLVVEKPPGDSAPAVRRLAGVLRETGVPHLVSLNRRYSPALSRARAWLAGLPPPTLAMARMLRHDRREEEFVFGTGIHLVDTVLAVMGRPVRVVSRVVPDPVSRTRSYVAQVGIADGGVASFAMAPAAGWVEETVEFAGEGYDVQVDMGRCALAARAEGKVVVSWQAGAEVEEWERNGTLDETRAFLRCLRTGQAGWPSAQEAVWSALTAAAIQEGGEVVLEEQDGAERPPRSDRCPSPPAHEAPPGSLLGAGPDR